jgi:hypothetical protein
MRLWRRRAVLENLSRPRLGLSEREVAASQRPRSGLIAVASAGHGFKCDGQGVDPGRNPQEHSGGAQ